MTADPRIDGYDWAGGREAMLRFGPDTGPLVVAALPLFEEANRTRAFMVAILRALAVRGIGSILPDMPGQGDSLVPLETVALADMRTAFAAAAGGRPCYTAGIRSGALLTNLVLPRRREPSLGPRLRGGTKGAGSIAHHWNLSPQNGPALRRELARMIQPDRGDQVFGDGRSPVLIAGNPISPKLLAELETAFPAAGRTIRLSTDPAPADRKVDGAPLWRRSEPGTDTALSQILADDIADWIATCEG